MQRGANIRTPIEKQFFSEQNEKNLFTVLAQDLQRTGALSKPQTTRLVKTLEHYMREVWDFNGPMPVQQLNREVLAATTRDFMSYLRHGEATPALAAAQKTILSQQVPPRPTFENNLLMDTGSRFEKLQQERVPHAPSKPAVPDFQISLSASADEPDALSLFEQARKNREAEAARTADDAKRLAGIASATGSASTDANPLVRFMSPPSIQNDAQANPTLAQPIAALAPLSRGPLPQDYLIKQDDIVNYKEIEHNLIVYSADRDWYNNAKETRYNFSVMFDQHNIGQGFTAQPSTNKKFKNIVRIELVKAILPSEGLENLVRVQDVSGSQITFDSSSKVNVLTYPYVLVRIPELDTNNYGTDNNLDNAFAVIQYDANWYTDTTNLSDGYFGMIPKFMKCQKVYQPTPLATLNKLSINFLRPDGLLLSPYCDTVPIRYVYQSGLIGAYASGYTGKYANAQDLSTSPPSGYYYILQTETYFSQWMFQPGNIIQIKGINPEYASDANRLAMDNLASYLQQEGGVQIVDIANTETGDGVNSAGYANLIIVRAPMVDPTSGSTSPMPLGGTYDKNKELGEELQYLYFLGQCINLTHQTSLVLRIITREMDPAARVRPDNL